MTKEKEQSNDLEKTDIEQIKNDLLERKAKIIQDLEEIAKKDEHDKDDHKATFPEYGSKADENALEISDYTTNLATEQILEKTLRDIDSALDRIEKNNYGICKYCGEPIGKKRLQARPVASACVPCKSKLQNS